MSYGLLELPDEVLGQVKPGIPDLRLYVQNEEIPYAILPSNLSEIEGRKLNTNVFNKGLDDKGNLVFEVQVPDNHWVKGINLLTNDINFMRKVKIEGSRDQNNWIHIEGDSTIFDLSRERKARNTIVYISKVNFPYLRITVVKDEDKPPFQINEVVLLLLDPQESIGELKERSYDLSTNSIKDGVQEIILDLYHANLPTQELELVTRDVNFSRLVDLYQSDNKENWSLVTKSELYSYEFDKASADQRRLQFKANNRYLRLKIYNQDNRPLNLEKIRVLGVSPTVIFPLEQSKKYTLYWGSKGLEKPNYDLQKLVTNLDYNKLSQVKVVSQQENPEFKDNRPWTERNGWLLNSVLVIVVLALVAIIARNFGKLSS